jgi:hypothetical protein
MAESLLRKGADVNAQGERYGCPLQAEDQSRPRTINPLSPEVERAQKMMEAIQKATREFKLCPNRIWAAVGSHPEREEIIHSLIQSIGKIGSKGDEGHDQCTFDFCEKSRLNFTAVEQRHESPCTTSNRCLRLRKLFPRAILEVAATNQTPTAWKLDGRSMIEPPQPFMAISHVWSDGTGAGAWPEGEVNSCLYNFFRQIAEQFQCKGIWWDTICIPKEKGARNKAINKIQNNYEDARITLVHDCFLRNWEWVDANTACFAIVMSPWFSRGWTSLELASSRKVKVVFKGPTGPLIKDLDEDILAEANRSSEGHKFTADVIAKLRSRRITKVNDLLATLGPRYTSWPKDVAIISGLLMGVEISPDASQQDIYREILERKTAEVCHGHLFHNSATMSESFTWCSASLLSLPVASGEATLRVDKNESVLGTWKVVDPNGIPEEIYVWNGTHPLIEASLRSALSNKGKHVLLVEPEVTTISRALLVRIMKIESAWEAIHCRFVGSVYFHLLQPLGEENESWIKIQVAIGGTE